MPRLPFVPQDEKPRAARLSDATASQTIKIGPREGTKLGALTRVVIHDNEEYGYMSVYLRLKGVVPPSSAK